MSRRSRLLIAVMALAVPLVSAAGVALAGPSVIVSAKALPSSDSGSQYAHRGAAVASSKLTVRVFTNAKNGFSLASVGQAQYPASTTDGGKTWRIDGPHFHVNAADAPDVVSRDGAAAPNTYFAYGTGMSVVVSTDRGKHWWRAYLPGTPVTVEPTFAGGGKAGLVAIVQSNPGKFLAYVTTDGGRHWRLHHGIV